MNTTFCVNSVRLAAELVGLGRDTVRELLTSLPTADITEADLRIAAHFAGGTADDEDRIWLRLTSALAGTYEYDRMPAL